MREKHQKFLQMPLFQCRFSRFYPLTLHCKYFSQEIEKFICIIEVKLLILQNQNKMETNVLDLNAYGVSEMNGAEMREVDGGLIIKSIIVTSAILTGFAASLEIAERIGYTIGRRNCTC